ncbi:MAG: site-specific DNA-methyltransferase [Candidatus Poribacteria bacterium]|nr:site-specific DNA-methyltransferase [Candidatus Poribacteria bacterium]
MLNWKGKRPFQSTQYYPAQLKETYGEDVDDWRNKIYWGDNLQVMSHLLKNYRGKINLIYIDPPFASKEDYKKRIKLKGKEIKNDHTVFEEKQYTDIWKNDEYLQFMYERLILMKELLAENGSIYVHCDPNMSHYLKVLMDTQIFSKEQFRNEIVWHYQAGTGPKTAFKRKHDIILFYAKSSKSCFNRQSKPVRNPARYKHVDEDGRAYDVNGQGNRYYLDEGQTCDDVWTYIQESEFQQLNSQAKGRTDYPTQKPDALLERIIKASSNPGDLVFDCFMGSGTTQEFAMKLGRRFIGADINLGAVETTTERLINIAGEIQENTAQEDIIENTEDIQTYYTGFEVYNVNQYDIFRNPVEATKLLIEALEIQSIDTGSIYDGEKDGRMVKVMPINRIATRADLNELITGFDYRAFQMRQEEHPTRAVESLLLVCMGHEPDLAAHLKNDVNYDLDIKVMDILRDKSKLEFKRESKAKIIRSNGQLTIEQFYPMNLLQKLSLMEENVEDWRELVESVKIDFNYDGGVLNPTVVDSPENDELVKGSYSIPEDAGTIRVKITDLLSESLEETVG